MQQETFIAAFILNVQTAFLQYVGVIVRKLISDFYRIRLNLSPISGCVFAL